MSSGDNYIMADAGITEVDIEKFWSKQEFDLAMPPAGVNTLSNCDLCFLKGYSIKQSIIEHVKVFSKLAKKLSTN